jgi:hypothetical protein
LNKILNANSPAEYECLDLAQPAIRPVSRLYHFNPIEIDSPFRESLTGYFSRLAEAHCVAPSILYWKEISRFTLERDIFGKPDNERDTNYSYIVNGTGSIARSFVEALEKLTLQKDLWRLTLVSWSEALPAKGLLRRYPSWCPICYQSWLEAGLPIYFPLLWALQVVTSCIKHQCRLSSRCRVCNRNIVYLSSRSRLGYCCWCGSWLGLPQIDLPSAIKQISPLELRWQFWVTDNIGELLSVRLPLPNQSFKRLFRQALTDSIDRVSNGETSDFALYIDESEIRLLSWCSGRKFPKLHSLLKISYCLGLSMVNLLCGRTSVTLFKRPFPLMHSKTRLIRKKRRRSI